MSYSQTTATDSATTLVFGGSGFLGSAIVRELVETGRKVRLAARHPVMPDWAEPDDPVELIRADIRSDDDITAALKGADTVINTVSLYTERRGLSFDDIHVQAARRLAQSARDTGIKRFIHISGIGADSHSTSAYVRARAHGEDAVLDVLPRAIIVRSSVLFGPDDALLSQLAKLTRLPLIPLFGSGQTRMEPLHVRDLARAITCLTGEPASPRRLFELGGPDIMSYRDILRLVMAHLGRDRPLVPVPFFLWRVIARLLAVLPNPSLTRDQVVLMAHDNLINDTMGTFADLGLLPHSLRDSLPLCLPQSASHS
ncbi:complex I NDUFA9 subunit family protein [Halomonas halocynthiae]|uniref:complex I NDUFA9 subunit family protein n=1 Tax=Halomonas halocynthiae TaxID=176290 RepID=UPI0003F8BB7E|nr:complex I NDUFA9 subunit family protein [Halomonas halocynthiae]